MDESHIPSAIDIEDDVQDWKLLGKITGTAIPKRGEKDERPDGTLVQLTQLQESKNAMYEAIGGGTRGHHLKQALICFWVPWEKHAVVPQPRGNYWKDLGRNVGNMVVLSALECLYLVERGSMVAYLMEDRIEYSEMASYDHTKCEPIDLAYLYALCFNGTDYTVDQYQIYSYLKRQGYLVRDHQEKKKRERKEEPSRLFRFAKGLLDSLVKYAIRVMSPLSFVGIVAYPVASSMHFSSKHYFSYSSVFKALWLVKPYRNSNTPETPNPLQLTFDAWKPSSTFSKKSPPVPDFHICVLKTESHMFPSLPQIRSLLSSIGHEFPKTPAPRPLKKKKEASTGQSKKELRIQRAKERHAKLDSKTQTRNTYLAKRDSLWKNGARSVILALANSGVINFVNISEGTFAAEDKELDGLIKREHRVVWMD